MNICATKTSFTNTSVNFQSLPKVLSFGFPKKDLYQRLQNFTKRRANVKSINFRMGKIVPPTTKPGPKKQSSLVYWLQNLIKMDRISLGCTKGFSYIVFYLPTCMIPLSVMTVEPSWTCTSDTRPQVSLPSPRCCREKNRLSALATGRSNSHWRSDTCHTKYNTLYVVVNGLFKKCYYYLFLVWSDDDFIKITVGITS